MDTVGGAGGGRHGIELVEDVVHGSTAKARRS